MKRVIEIDSVKGTREGLAYGSNFPSSWLVSFGCNQAEVGSSVWLGGCKVELQVGEATGAAMSDGGGQREGEKRQSPSW